MNADDALRILIEESGFYSEAKIVEAEFKALREKVAMYEGQTRFLCQCGGVKPEGVNLS